MKKRTAIDMDQVIADLEVCFIDLCKENYHLPSTSAEVFLRTNPDFDLITIVKELFIL